MCTCGLFIGISYWLNIWFKYLYWPEIAVLMHPCIAQLHFLWKLHYAIIMLIGHIKQQPQMTCKEKLGCWLWMCRAPGHGPDGGDWWCREAQTAGAAAQQRGGLDRRDERRVHWPIPLTLGFDSGGQCKGTPTIWPHADTGPAQPLAAASGNPFCALKREVSPFTHSSVLQNALERHVVVSETQQSLQGTQQLSKQIHKSDSSPKIENSQVPDANRVTVKSSTTVVYSHLLKLNKPPKRWVKVRVCLPNIQSHFHIQKVIGKFCSTQQREGCEALLRADHMFECKHGPG